MRENDINTEPANNNLMGDVINEEQGDADDHLQTQGRPTSRPQHDISGYSSVLAPRQPAGGLRQTDNAIDPWFLYGGNVAAACQATNAVVDVHQRSREEVKASFEDDEKRRQKANSRLTAWQSRERKRIEFEVLQERETELKNRNSHMRRDNEQLKMLIANLKSLPPSSLLRTRSSYVVETAAQSIEKSPDLLLQQQDEEQEIVPPRTEGSSSSSDFSFLPVLHQHPPTQIMRAFPPSEMQQLNMLSYPHAFRSTAAGNNNSLSSFLLLQEHTPSANITPGGGGRGPPARAKANTVAQDNFPNSRLFLSGGQQEENFLLEPNPLVVTNTTGISGGAPTMSSSQQQQQATIVGTRGRGGGGQGPQQQGMTAPGSMNFSLFQPMSTAGSHNYNTGAALQSAHHGGGHGYVHTQPLDHPPGSSGGGPDIPTSFTMGSSSSMLAPTIFAPLNRVGGALEGRSQHQLQQGAGGGNLVGFAGHFSDMFGGPSDSRSPMPAFSSWSGHATQTAGSIPSSFASNLSSYLNSSSLMEEKVDVPLFRAISTPGRTRALDDTSSTKQLRKKRPATDSDNLDDLEGTSKRQQSNAASSLVADYLLDDHYQEGTLMQATSGADLASNIFSSTDTQHGQDKSN